MVVFSRLLTYMSIHDEIKFRCDGPHPSLFRIGPTLGGRSKRFLYGTREINKLVVGPWSDQAEEIRCGRLWQDFDRYVEEKLISISLEPYKKPKSTYLARLDPGRDEVWEIRSRFPRRGIRVFGRFADADHLVLLNWEYRDNLGGPGSDEFKVEMRKAKAEWKRLFQTYEAHTGVSIHDYVTRNCFPVGNPKRRSNPKRKT
jgi:hypothetical protein